MIRPAVAAATLCLCVVVTGCGDTVVVVQAPTTTALTSIPATANSPGTTTLSAADASGGTLVVTLTPVGDTTVTADLVALAITRLEDRAAALGYDAVATVTTDGKLQVTIDAVARGDADRVAARIASFSGQVYLRPVLIDDQFGIPCVTSAPGAPTTTTTANNATVTTTIVSDSTSILPDVPPDMSGFVRARGGGLCKVGPAGGSGAVFSDAQSTQIVGSGWGVTATLRTGPSGQDLWNALATQCFNATATCPTRQLAIELDGEVISAPTVQQAEFTDSVQITGSFTEAEADNLANVLNGGAIPATFKLESTAYLPG